jgi:hypothetical protein
VLHLQTVQLGGGVVGLLRALSGFKKAEAVYPCYVAMCTVKDLATLEQSLDPEQLREALKCYQNVLMLDLKEFSGWQFVSAEHYSRDSSTVIFGFHELADSMAWAMRTAQNLLSTSWPDFLNSVECSRTIYYRSEDRKWQKIFAGLRVSTAITKQMLSGTTRLVRC